MTGPLSDAYLYEVRERCLKTSPGPWWNESLIVHSVGGVHVCNCERDSGNDFENAEFIAHARVDVLNLLDEIDRLRGIIDVFRKMFGDSMIEWAEWRSQFKREIRERGAEIRNLLGGNTHD